jgi:hypothetical protein
MTAIRRRVVAAIIPFLVVALPMTAQAAGTLDAQSTTFGSARALIGTHENGQDVIHAQTFRAGVSGLLDQVDVPIRVVGDPGVALKVEIRALDGSGLPAAVLGSATVAQASVPACNTAACIDKSAAGDYTTFSFVAVPLASPALVSAGTDYAIELSATGAQLDIYGDMVGRTANRYEWAATTDESAYPDGSGLSYLGGFGWVPSNADKAFKVYIGPGYSATIRQPINADGSSTFKAGRGVVPVKFELAIAGAPTCSLPPATIALTRTSGSDPGSVNEAAYLLAADNGSSFRVTDCQYVYNLNAKTLPAGTYRVEIRIDGQTVGSATFDLR